MVLFAVNTGCREQEICRLRWEWEIRLPDGKGSVFIIPRQQIKNREERLVILNRVACSVIESVLGQHLEYVFTYKGNPIKEGASTKLRYLLAQKCRKGI